MQCHMQAGEINSNLKVKIDFTLPELSVTNIVACVCHVNYSSNSRCNIILGRYILTELVLNLKLSGHVIEGDYGVFQGSVASMVDLGTYKFKYFKTGKIIPQ